MFLAVYANQVIVALNAKVNLFKMEQVCASAKFHLHGIIKKYKTNDFNFILISGLITLEHAILAIQVVTHVIIIFHAKHVKLAYN